MIRQNSNGEQYVGDFIPEEEDTEVFDEMDGDERKMSIRALNINMMGKFFP